MAMGKEIMGGSMIERSSFVSSTKVFLNHGKNNNMFLVKHLEKRRAAVPLRKVVKGPVVAAVSEDLVKSVPVVSVTAEKFRVRAVVTVENKNKQDFKDKIVKHLDCLTDNIGRNIVLQLVSTEIDPSKPISYSGCVRQYIYYCLKFFCHFKFFLLGNSNFSLLSLILE